MVFDQLKGETKEMRSSWLFLNDPCPSRQDREVTVWRGSVNANLTVAVFQYADQDTFVARAMQSDQTRSFGVTSHNHSSRRTAAEEALRMAERLELA